MRNKLDALISEIVGLLQECNWPKEAAWFADIGQRVRVCEEGSAEYNRALSELRRSLTGMGSFSDMPLKSSRQHRSEAELEDRQWELADKLAQEIDALLADGG
jgi:hypothetical protein